LHSVDILAYLLLRRISHLTI